MLWLPTMIGDVTFQQAALMALMAGVLGMLVWGRLRYDLVAFAALVIAVLLGVVDQKQAFAGFGHPAVIVIALVLVISRGLAQAGVIDIITRRLVRPERGLAAHIAIMGALGAVLSAFMNNVAALALLMPVDIAAARQARRSPALTLMPLSFATILGGMTTQIGTPPNIVIAQFRDDALGAPYAMFDFSPVGVGVAAAGMAFIALVGWRLIPRRAGRRERGESATVDDYVMELVVGADSPVVGQRFAHLRQEAEKNDLLLAGLVRRGQRLARPAREELRRGDVLVVEGGPEGLETFANAHKLDFSRSPKHARLFADTLEVAEVAVPREARIVNRSAQDMRLLARHGVVLAGISRHGRRLRGRVRQERIQAGDLLLLMGPRAALDEVVGWLRVLPLRGRDITIAQRQKAGMATALFAVAILLSAFELVYLPIALAAVAIAFVLLRVLSLSQIYDTVEWPVIVLLASLIPIGAAMESSGATQLIAGAILALTQGMGPVAVLVVIMIITMTLSDMLNNVATVLVAAPVAVSVAQALSVNPDTMLMGVAVAASCAFLTPIGHKNNTIVMGPGGYAFGDYWRLGLPLELVVLAVSVPLLLLFWPL